MSQNNALESRDTVILLHGLGRTKRSLKKLHQALKKEGLKVINIDYPSRNETMQNIANRYLDPVIKKESQAGNRIHFVTHSLGGILVRYYLKDNPLENPGKVVMLSPPNQGSEVADFLKGLPFCNKTLGPSGQELGTDYSSVPNILGPVDFELGVICGNRTSDPWFSFLFKGANDGKVSVDSARISGMKDFRVVPYGHTLIMNKPDVIRMTITFIREGKFSS